MISYKPCELASFTINGQLISGITSLYVKMGMEEQLVPSSTTPGAYILKMVPVHYLVYEREVFDDGAAFDVSSLSDFSMRLSFRTYYIDYTECEIGETEETVSAGGKMTEKVKIEIGEKAVSKKQ